MTPEQVRFVCDIKRKREELKESIREAKQKLEDLPTVEQLAEQLGTSTQAICRAREATLEGR